MVGIVIVSHSHRIAAGVVELAREMGGPDVAIEPAGGLTMPEHPIGTDAVVVMEAIERAWSDEGVLVLMDLGSAVLSAEMALDLLPPERRGRIRLSEAPLVEGAVAAAVVARAGGSLEQVAAEARSGIAAKAAHLGVEPLAAAPEPGGGADRGGARVRIVVHNAHGLHARPAARLVRVASAFDADVRVRNATTGAGPASARSLNGVATLGIERGHEIEATASGPDARLALEALEALAGRGFDETGPVGSTLPGAVARASAADAVAEGAGGPIRGLAASPGVAIGPARRFHEPDLVVPDDLEVPDPEIERRRLDDALTAISTEIDAQRAAVPGTGDAAAIFDAHALFLRDEALLEPARSAIGAGRSAAVAWRDAVATVAAHWEAIPDPYLRARVDDLRSVGRQVLAGLLGVPRARPALRAPGILVAADLTAADTAGLDPAVVLGVATAAGTPTSHASVLARALGIPAVTGAGPSILAIGEGTMLGLDGGAGTVLIDPPAPERQALEARRERERRASRAAQSDAALPAVTRDGTTVEVALNIGSPAEAAAAGPAGADGVGLFRTEVLFMGRDRMPDEDEQVAAYREAASSLDGRSMIVRTLDVGADKPLPYLARPPEANPFLGVRGVRLGLAWPSLLRTQLRAILRTASDHPVRVLFPMVATLDELRAARTSLEQARDELGDAAGDPEVGIMVEVPSAALLAGRLAPEVDFFSVGTNDLTQYTLAADRGNEGVGTLADPLHPAVLRLIAQTVEGARGAGRWVGVCGELAGDPDATELLLGLGVRELSMSAPAVARVKAAVRATDVDRARALAEDALALATAGDVRALLDAHRAG
jgi:multiphosphoryl transfer protein